MRGEERTRGFVLRLGTSPFLRVRIRILLDTTTVASRTFFFRMCDAMRALLETALVGGLEQGTIVGDVDEYNIVRASTLFAQGQ